MDQAIVLGRVGHYFNSGNGACSTALIVEANADGEPVNVAGWTHDGATFSRAAVPVVAAPTREDTASSFHLTRDCPWSR